MPCFARRIILLVPTLFALAAITGCDFTQPIELNPPDVVEVDQWPAWSPGGTRIAYLHDAGGTEDSTDVTGLYILNLEADTTRLVVEGFTMSPDWHPDGQRIAFSTGDIFTIRSNGSDLRRITDRGTSFRPHWSPNGLAISFGRSGPAEEVGLWFAHLEDSTFTRFGWVAYSDWSPDGERIVYNYEDHLWTADTSRTDSTQLTANDFVDNRYPEWSPNGKWIAWAPVHKGDSEIWIMRADGSAPRKLIAGGATPTWGPNSERIVFARASQESDYTALWMIRRDGSDLRQLTVPASSNQ